MNKLKKSISYGGSLNEKNNYWERAINLGRYIIETKETVSSTAKKFRISKSTVHMDVTLKNGLKTECVGAGFHPCPIPESVEIKKVFLADKNPVVKLGLVIK